MELKEYIQIFKKHSKLFWLSVVLFAIMAFSYQILAPTRYASSLVMNVTREGTQKTQDYRYDEFYRLQADERFADTVVRWLGAPGIASDICDDAGACPEGGFKARRLSSQMIEVNYATRNTKAAEKIAISVGDILSREIEKLNQYQKNDAWFKILVNDPEIMDGRIGPWKLLLGSLSLGAFVGFWAVFAKHYFS